MLKRIVWDANGFNSFSTEFQQNLLFSVEGGYS